MKRRKILYFICLLGILWLNIIYIEYQMFFLLVIFVAVPALSWILMKLSEIGTNISIMVPKKKIYVGEKTVFGVFVSNDIPIPMCDSNIFVTISYKDDFEERKQTITTDVFLNSSKIKRVVVKPQHCGILKIQIEGMKNYDYLKMFSDKLEYNGVQKVVIYPELITTDSDYQIDDNGESEKYMISYEIDDNTEVLDIHQYNEGDSIRHIHWNLSSRGDDIMVKQYGQTCNEQYLIIVDLTKKDTENFRSKIDVLYSFAYSIGYVYAVNNKKSAFVVWNNEAGIAEYYYFYDIKTLDAAIMHVMENQFSEKAADKIYEQLYSEVINLQNKPMFITMSDYDLSEYMMVNINNCNLKDVIENMENMF